MPSAIHIDQVYVLHVKKGFEARAAQIEKQFSEMNIAFQYILEGDIPEITPDILDRWFAAPFDKPAANTSCVYKHLLACQYMLERGFEHILVFEDDAILDPRFVEVFNGSMQELQQWQSYACLVSYENSGLEFISKAEYQSGKYLYPRQAGRCAGAYVINRKFAEYTLAYASQKRCSMAIDWVHNEMAQEFSDVRILWCEPAVVEQGSHNGTFDSSLESVRAGWWRRFRFRLQKWVKQKR